jgi:beta-lactamase superfamily II metal-dependent hydrolase
LGCFLEEVAMAAEDELVVRVYNVGFGDCIYIGVPDVYEDAGALQVERRHILIDCGTIKKPSREQGYETQGDVLRKALEDVREMLPEVDGKRRLDLLVVTHPHRDHYDGFDPEYDYFESFFDSIAIDHIWLSALMDKDHPDRAKLHAVEQLAYRGILALEQRDLRLGDRVREEVLWASETELERIHGALRGLSAPREPLYVFRDIADPQKGHLEPEEVSAHRLAFDPTTRTTCFSAFNEAGTRLRILGPEWDIDKQYLHEGGDDIVGLLKSLDEPFGEHQVDGRSVISPEEGAERAGVGDRPRFALNVSATDYRNLRRRLYCSTLLFALDDSELKNNTSVVLLLEWRGKRLLFTGDVQHTGWEVMEAQDNQLPAADRQLTGPLAFLKVGHHGSHNATPFWPAGPPQPAILDSLLPTERQNEAVTAVSVTPHGSYDNIPLEGLLGELGRRAHVRRTDIILEPPGLGLAYNVEHTDSYIEVTFTSPP